MKLIAFIMSILVICLSINSLTNSQSYKSLGPSPFVSKPKMNTIKIEDKYDRNAIALLMLQTIILSPNCEGWYTEDKGNNTYQARVESAYNFADAFLEKANK